MDKIVVSDLVNSEHLTEKQKQDYCSGNELELPDGTKFKLSGVVLNSVRSNRLMLIAFLLGEGGLAISFSRA